MKVGGGTPPVRTPRGWLSLYHGHVGSSREASKRGDIGSYAAATLLQDLDNPSRIVGMSREPVMLAEADFERSGYLPNIVFPTAMLRRPPRSFSGSSHRSKRAFAAASFSMYQP